MATATMLVLVDYDPETFETEPRPQLAAYVEYTMRQTYPQYPVKVYLVDADQTAPPIDV